MRNNMLKFIGILFLLFIGNGILHAYAQGSEEATFSSLGQYRRIHSRYYSGNVIAGSLIMTVNGTDYESFCINLFKTISIGDELVVNGPLSEDVMEQVDWCSVNFIINTFASNYTDASQQADEAAAIQAAIWYFVTEPYGDYDGSGEYQFMTDPTNTVPYDAYRNGPAIRNRAFEMINSVPRDVDGNCTFKFPERVELSPDVSIECGENLTATVYDQIGDPMEGVDVTFDNSTGKLNITEGTTDENGLISAELTDLTFGTNSTVWAYATGDYGTLLFDPNQDKQTISTITLIPRSISDSSIVICTEDPSIDIEKYISSDDNTWLDADEEPGLKIFEDHDVYYKFVVTNTGNVPLENIVLTDSNYTLNECEVLDPLPINGVFECVIGPYTAELGKRTNTATVTGDYEQTTYSDSDPANYHGLPTYTKGGTVFFDKDQDSEQDPGENGFPEVTLFLCLECPIEEAAPCPTVAITMTDSNGYYEFNELPARTYIVSIPRDTDNPDDFNEELYEVYRDKVNYNELLNRSCIFFELTSDETDNNFPFILDAVGGTIDVLDFTEYLVNYVTVVILPVLAIILLLKIKDLQ
ncbi:hypothetical protein GF319_07430 [Candidatus Bathyarchaeota archaeon]|nr:hypothetical protein [Candidatus Bathyarchaeota archaeon]